MSNSGEEAFLLIFISCKSIIMVDILKYSVGIDVACQDLQVGFGYLSSDLMSKRNRSRKFDNSKSGFKSLSKWIDKQRTQKANVSVIMEATGVYHENVAHYLYDKGYDIYVVLPNKAKRYLQSLGLRSKNDPIDCAGLTQMGLDQQHLQKWLAPDQTMRQLRALTRHRQSIQQQITNVNNQLHAIQIGFYEHKIVKQSLKQTIRFHKKQILKIDQDILDVLAQDELLKAKVEKIVESIKGLGVLTLVTVIAETNGFQNFHSIQALVKYAGYDVIEHSSGKKKGKEHISKKGNSRIRRILHLPALNMVTHQVGSFSNNYERIFQKTGIKMKGYVAIQRKLLCLIYTLWKKDQIFDPNYVHPLSS